MAATLEFDFSNFKLPILGTRYIESRLMSAALNKMLPDLRAMHEEYTLDWVKSPTFQTGARIDNDKLILEVIPSTKLWFWLDKGVKGHIISPRLERFSQVEDPRLKFIGSSGMFVFPRMSRWPGISPRGWSSEIVATYMPVVRTKARKAAFDGVKDSFRRRR